MNMLPITRPSLSETQDRLRMLPRSGPYLQKTIQYLTAAAQGQIPSVEPYIALGELNNIKQEMEKQQSAQQAAGAGQAPLVQSLPQEARQAAGIASLMQGRQQQGMQQMAQAAQRMPQPVPENVDGVGIMDGGGSPKGFGSGGIIAFADGRLVAEPPGTPSNEDGEGDENDAEAVSPEEIAASRDAALARLQALQKTPMPGRVSGPDEAAIRRGILEGASPAVRELMGQDIGSNVAGRLRELTQAREEEIAKKRADEERLKKIDFWNSVFEGTEASRGQQGAANIGAFFGGLGRSLGRSEKAAIEREQALRGESLTLKATENEVLNKVDELRRAKVEGDVDKQVRLGKEIAELQTKLDVAGQNRISKELSGLYGYMGKVDSGSIAAAARRAAAAKSAIKERKLNEMLADAEIAVSENSTPENRRRVEALRRAVDRTKTSDIGDVRAAIAREQLQNAEDKDVSKNLNDWAVTDGAYRGERDPVKKRQMLADKEAELRAQYRRNQASGGTSAPAARSVAPATGGTVNFSDLPR